MFYFEGSKCSRCGEVLKESDDIVACPVCGSPHHRGCYTENGGCANEERHEEGFEWKREITGDSGTENSATAGKIYCGVCGAENTKGRLYCCNCGKPLFDDEAGTRAAADGKAQDYFENEKIDDIPLRDISRFIGNSGIMYAPMFHHMHKYNKKVSFNFFALFIPSFWYLSRKMYLHGLSIILFNIISYAFNFFFYDVMLEVYNASMAFDQNEVMRIISEHPFVTGGILFFSLMSYVIAILSALFCNRIYMNWSLRKIRRLKARIPDEASYLSALDAHGRSNFGVVVLIMLLYFIAIMGLERFIQ